MYMKEKKPTCCVIYNAHKRSMDAGIPEWIISFCLWSQNLI